MKAWTLLAAALGSSVACTPPAGGGGTDSGQPPPSDSGNPGADAGGGTDAGGGRDSGYVWDGGTFSNVVDGVIIPMELENGLPVVEEDPGILCRRLAIDLNGITPTASEISGICAQTPPQIVDYYMNKASGPSSPSSPPYVYVNQRWWADSFQYQPRGAGTSFPTFEFYILDLDALVGQLYAGTIQYDEFTRRALASPAFARRFGIISNVNHDLIQIASQAYRVFIGREALPSEAQDFGNLWGGWAVNYVVATVGDAGFPTCTQTGDTDGCRHDAVGLDGRQCAGLQALTCESTVLGPYAAIPGTLGFVEYTDVNHGFSAADEQTAEAPGRAFIAQREWAEAAVDRVLVKYLGWWKAGVYLPDFQVPAVRDALVQYFINNGYDIRALEKEVLTSVLYTQQAALQPGQQPANPLWAYGPTKVMYGEAWLDSLGQALGKKLGGCDYRFLADPYVGTASFTYQYPLSAGVSANYYPGQASLMGACPTAAPHGDPTGLLPAATRRAVTATLCPGAFKPTSGMALDALANLEFSTVGRNANAWEVQDIVMHLEVPADGSCDPNNLNACALQGIADGLCGGLFASAAFTYY